MKNMTKIQDVRSMFILISDKLKWIHTLILHVLTNCGHDSSSVKVWHIHIDQGRAIESSLSTSKADHADIMLSLYNMNY